MIEHGEEYVPKPIYRLKEEDIYSEPKTVNSKLDKSNEEIKHSVSVSVFVRKPTNKHVKLQDFEIKSVIGRGSFGKVFLVQKKTNGKVYAMKSLRKDVILEYDQLEATLLEKKILIEAEHTFLVGMEYVF